MSLETPFKIRMLQRKLYLKAKAEPDYCFYLLYDVMDHDLLPRNFHDPNWQVSQYHATCVAALGRSAGRGRCPRHKPLGQVLLHSATAADNSECAIVALTGDHRVTTMCSYNPGRESVGERCVRQERF
jgi:hypothetical protein